MPSVQAVIRELAKHAISKRGARQSLSHANLDVLKEPCIEVPGASWTQFFNLSFTNDKFSMPVVRGRLVEYQRRYPAIKEQVYVERDGHTSMDVPLTAGIPVAFLKSLIDEAHELVWKKLDRNAQLQIELAGLPYDEKKLLERLIKIHDLKAQQKAIRKIIRPAILLRTKKSSEVKIPLGATKIGGRPDLPKDVAWPVFANGQPLAFLAQIDLAKIAKLGSPIKGLPKDGLLSLFSVWGWMEDGGGGPNIPAYDEVQLSSQQSWTIVVHTPRRAKLERRKTPRGVNLYKAAAVDLTPISSLPNHRVEPALAALKWSDDLYERFDNLQSDFRSLQMGHWLKNNDVFASHHLLGGYALFQQQFPEGVLERGLAMLLQIGTDDKTDMSWSDGGELTFYADAKALAKGRFERIWGTCQGG